MEAGTGQVEPGAELDAGVEEAVDLPPRLCAELRDLAGRLDSLDCYQILGLPRGADADRIRGAFFECSRRFHPDRYFNKRLGPYQELLHQVYKRVVAANEVLRDPELRSVYDASLSKERGVTFGRGRLMSDPGLDRPQLPGSEPGGAPAEAKPGAGPKRKGPSLRERGGLRAPSAGLDGLMRQLEANRSKGSRHFKEAQACAARLDWEGAVRSARMALAFAPRDPQFHSGLSEWLPRVQQERSHALVARAESLLVRGEESAALDAFVEAFRILPTDPNLALRTAALAQGYEERLAVALEMAECAVALDGEDMRGRKLLGLLCLRVGRRDQGRAQLQIVWKRDPLDTQVKQALASL